ncbi:MAG TPA: threonine synthase [Burkholderiales bacterium]|nr:threonine synthase [Burkholderiales bacterium]
MNLTHLEVIPGGESVSPDQAINAAPGTLLYARYDLARIRAEWTPQDIARGPASLWRYAPLLPIRDPKNIVSLSEGWTPLIRTERLAGEVGCDNLWIKDEGRNPSGTFKDRGAAVAVSRYKELGVKAVALHSSGNAGGSWALYAARAGLACTTILPTDAQSSSRRHCELGGAHTYYTEDWHNAGKIVADAAAKYGWLNVNTLKEPYRTEGKKTMGLEIAEQLGWQLPDAVIYPVGGGLGAIAIWKAFEELLALGWVKGRMPKLVITQFAGCAPVVKAFEEGKSKVEEWGALDVPPGGLKSTNPPAGDAVLAIIRQHGGAAISVTTDEAIVEVGRIAQAEGIFAAPESATIITGLRKALQRGIVDRGERIVAVSTGSGLKSIPTLPVVAEHRIKSAAEIAES